MKDNYSVLNEEVKTLVQQTADPEKRQWSVSFYFAATPLSRIAPGKLTEKKKEFDKISGMSDVMRYNNIV